MDHTRDNPLKRFKAFWIANLLVLSFGVALILLRPLTHMDADSAMDVAGKERLEVKKEVDRAQSEALKPDSLQAAMAEQLKTFQENTVKKGGRPVPSAAPAPVKDDEPAPAEGEKPAADGQTKEAPIAAE
jgi:hypothetical protein